MDYVKNITNSINSSKVYCKLPLMMSPFSSVIVLIVAKCIVNIADNRGAAPLIVCINSSKVYCKSASAMVKVLQKAPY